MKRIFFLWPFISALVFSQAFSKSNEFTPYSQEINHLELKKALLAPVQQKDLPLFYQKVLINPLMTQSLKNYYQRTPIIKVVSAKEDKESKTYHRVILMLIDRNKKRNKPKQAEEKGDVKVIEFAAISFNFKALPQEIKAQILGSFTPFGQLLILHRIKTATKNRAYFSLSCNAQLKIHFDCKKGERIYGRTNTLLNSDTEEWLAKTVEIVPSALHAGN